MCLFLDMEVSLWDVRGMYSLHVFVCVSTFYNRLWSSTVSFVSIATVSAFRVIGDLGGHCG